ncbi:DUF695 domain-containing protein [Paenibacillus soyae]|uniref:DUF695 domain-containing protein n=1 Tax=Paenibacillus soyae TaxID=2969249 RepID=A0A9X2MPF7_9BACL|nr:DUF695 domain-containing protein [Paenibacillus soyae]MCR2805783.1 DUF695 domain-containing protein [Paenibacillus soyae]
MSDHWNTYLTSIDKKPASFLLDMEPWKDGDKETFIHLFRLRVMLNEPTEEGLTSNEEASVLYALEDSINDALGPDYLFVGRITTDGRRDFFYYTESADGSQLASLAESCIGDHLYSVARVEEKEPRSFYYESLYPDKINWNRMANRQLVQKLNELGDSLTIPRIVRHWIYFDSAESRSRFKDHVQEAGFRIEDQDFRDNKYSLIVSREDAAEFDAISEVTDELVHAAERYDGDYDGWETQVVKEKAGFLGGLKKMFKIK